MATFARRRYHARMKKRTLILGAGGLAAIGVAGYGAWRASSQGAPKANQAVSSRVAQAPDAGAREFFESSMPDLQGQAIALARFSGKPLLVNFWATTCTTCIGEMPRMVETYKALAPNGYEMVAIAMDYDRPDWVLAYAQKNALPFTVALDIKGEAAQAFGGVRLTPTSFLIDKQGRIVQQFLGEPDFVKLKATISELLKQSA